MSEKTLACINLILVNGKEIEIWYPEDCDYFEEVYAEMENAIEMGSVWWVGNWTDWKATYMGERLDNINCALVVGYK